MAYAPLIIGTVQRGQEVDNSIIGNSTFLTVGLHTTDDDARYISKKLGVDLSKIPREKYKFFQWNSINGVLAEFGSDLIKSKKNDIWLEGAPRFRTFSNGGNGRKVLSVGDRLQFKNVKY